MKKIILLFALFALFAIKTQSQTVTDFDGNVYDTVHIGSQVWLKQNLNVTHYSTGNSIPNVLNGTAWSELTTGAYCDFDNITGNSTIYGKLYNWYSVIDTRNLCPSGWHVPNQNEWSTLVTFLGGVSVAGGKLKEADTTHWNSPNTGANNESDFTALPGGKRFSGIFDFLGDRGYWWTTTEFDSTKGIGRILTNTYSSVGISYAGKEEGYSVRCLMGDNSSIKDLNYPHKLNLYPNPAIDKVYINNTKQEEINMQIFNVLGDIVMKRKIDKSTNEIDISYLPKGIYIVVITGDDWTKVQKLIKK